MKNAMIVLGLVIAACALPIFTTAQVPTVDGNPKKIDRIAIANDVSAGADLAVPLANPSTMFVTDIVLSAPQAAAEVTITSDGPQGTILRKVIVPAQGSVVVSLNTAVEVKKNGTITISADNAPISFTISGYTKES